MVWAASRDARSSLPGSGIGSSGVRGQLLSAIELPEPRSGFNL